MVTQKNSTERLAGVTITSIGLCLLFSLLIYVFNRDAFTSVGVSFLLATLYYLLAFNKDTASNLFHPYSYFILYTGILFFGFPAGLVAIEQDLLSSLGFSTEHLGVVSFMVSGFFIMYFVGYKLPVGQILAETIPLFGFPKRPSRKQYIFAAIVLYSVGWLARIIALALGSHHDNPDLGEALTLVSSVLKPLSTFATLSFIVLIWDKFRHAKKKTAVSLFSPLIMVLFILEVMAGVLDGSRSSMIFPLVYVAFVYNYTVNRIMWRHVILGIVILVGILAPVTTLYRHAYFGELKEGGASIEGVRRTVEDVAEGANEWQYENLLIVTTERLSSQLNGALTVYDKVPSQIDYAEGGTFFPSAFLNFIPRLLWPDKPLYFPGREMAQIFWNRNVGELYATNMAISIVGEAYYNFGWLGLFIAIPLGVILRTFTERLSNYSRIEVNYAPRLHFAVFVVPAIGSLHYYPSELIRSALVYLLYLSILNYGVPRVLHYRSGCASH